ncbi:MAG TPA: DUF885 domain-containing protein [Gemmatimonadota bacterium]|nr:DUF885 domain-containing protein [Gemmatimonadota bacterium]
MTRLPSLRFVRAAAPALFFVCAAAAAQSPPASWVERSNPNARLMLDMQARFAPEFAARAGVTGLDEEIFDLKPALVERTVEATRKVVDELKKRLATEKDPLVRQDLEILIRQGEEGIEGVELSERLQVPYFNLPQTIFAGIRSLLDDQVAADRRPKALVRLRRYAGLEPGYTPITELARDRIRERLARPGLLGPVREEVEKDLANAASFADGIGKLFEKYGIAGYAEPYAKLRQQLAEYEKFIRSEVLPRARTDFRQPEELYAFSLKQVGVDMPVADLVSRAHVAFREIQNEMQALAPLVAKEKGLTATDYREVIRALKKEQVAGDAILPLYEKRITELERLIAEKGVITLPNRKMRIRLATEAESAAQPAPNMRPPRLIGNTGEQGEFVLPLKIAGKAGAALSYDDFTFDAAAWTLTVHEGRPGHELQFSALVERGVSLARAIYAFNSVNVEGWALYAEAEMKPYLPLDGQLISLQHRLMRAARAFLDPGLQLGRITREEATRVLREDVVLSEAMALQEVERYTFRAPGQATAYFCGYTRLMELRAEAERILGPRFDRRAFHDFVLAQGLLPPALLRKAVMEDMIPKRKAA